MQAWLWGDNYACVAGPKPCANEAHGFFGQEYFVFVELNKMVSHPALCARVIFFHQFRSSYASGFRAGSAERRFQTLQVNRGGTKFSSTC
jgi:hypothetical protein